MPCPSKEETKRKLEAFHRGIRSVVEKAWGEQEALAKFKVASGFGPALYARTVANEVFDAIARNALKEFAGNTAIHIEIEPQTIKLFFKGDVLARFKKGNANRLGSNVKTGAVLAFTEADDIFPGFPPETAKIEFIWVANEIGTRLESVLVVARDGDRLVWDYEIEAEAESGTGTVVPFPPRPPISPMPTTEETLVVAKVSEVQSTSDKPE